MRERLVRGAGLAAAGFILSRAITLGGYVAIAALISPKAAGQFAAGSLIPGIGVLFAASGMSGAVIQWRGDVDEAASTAFVATLLSGLLVTGLAAAASPLIGLFFHSDRVGSIALACSGLLLVRSIQVVPDALLQRRFSFLRRVVIDPLGAATFLVVAVIACSNGLGPWGLVLGTYALYVVQAVAAWGFVRWRPRMRHMSFATWRTLAGFGRHIVASEVVRQSAARLDALLLGRFAGAGTLGQYDYGLRLATQPAGGFVSIAAYVLLPAFARVAEVPGRLRDPFMESLSAATFVIVPVSLLLLPLGDQIALLALGPEWPGAGNALKALCLLGVGMTWGSLASEAFKALGSPRHITRMHTVSLVASLILMPSLVWADEVGIGLAVSSAAIISGLFGLRRLAPLLDASLLALLRPMAGTFVAAVLGLVAAGALDSTIFTDTTTRAGAAVAIAVEGGALLAVYVGAVAVIAPAPARRVVGLVRHLRPAATA